MRRAVQGLGPLLLIGAWLGFPPAAAAVDNGGGWFVETAAGVDASSHTYHLAVDDTTETIAEFMIQAAVEGRSARRARHRWRLRGEASAGTELYRQGLDVDYRYLNDDGIARWRLDGLMVARQYRGDTDYTYNSDNAEGRGELRAAPVVGRRALIELRGWSGFRQYAAPSELEVNDRELGGGVYVKSAGFGPGWSAGLRASRRAYPDSSVIDRDQVGIDLGLDSQGIEGGGLSVFHRTQRRTIADETVRPSAWSHWTDVMVAVPAGSGEVDFELQNEVWTYDEESSVWFDSWRLDGYVGYRGGDILTVGWLAGLAAARFDAGDNPDTYHQYGIRAGIESYASSVSGTLTVEVGRRSYRDGSLDVATDTDEVTLDIYSDFTYWKIWLLGEWAIRENLALEALASWTPENHTETADDSALGFANLRLVWRP